MANHPDVEKALEEVIAELKALPSAEFRALIEKHSNGDIARALYYAWHPTGRPDYYYKDTAGTMYHPDRDPEVTCGHCKKTFLCDMMDASCRMCGEWFRTAKLK